MGNNKTYLILLAVFLVIFVGTSLMLFLSTKKLEQSPASAPTNVSTIPVVIPPTVAAKKGSMTLQTASGAANFHVGNPVTIQLLADSQNEGIVGWDSLVSYDMTAVDFIGATSSLPDFKIYPYQRAGYVTLTGLQLLQSKTSRVFTGQTIATLTFRPKKAGNLVFSLEAAEGNEKTDLVTAQTKALYPQLNSVTVEIR